LRSAIIIIIFLFGENLSAQIISESTKQQLRKIYFGMEMNLAKTVLGKPLSEHKRNGDLKAGKVHHRREVFVLKYSDDLSLQFEKHFRRFKFNKKAYLNYVRLNDTIVVREEKQLKELAK
jgi:hypothetical protein